MPFSLHSFVSSYSGHGKIFRLIWVADDNPRLAVDALLLALEEIKKGSSSSSSSSEISAYDTATFSSISSRLSSLLPSFKIDTDWMREAIRVSEKTKEELQQKVFAAKNNGTKEAMVKAMDDLADFMYHTGNFESALKEYQKLRDLGTPRQQVERLLKIIEISLLTFDVLAQRHITKAQSKGVNCPIIQTKLDCCAGIASMYFGGYKNAAKKFEKCADDVNFSFPEVISPSNVAVYGALCALASFDRPELLNLKENVNFSALLEQEPAIKGIFNDFINCKYASCLNSLKVEGKHLVYDHNLKDRFKSIYTKIRSRAIKQYCSPYLSASITKMADALGIPLTDLEKELTDMINRGALKARIDSQHKIIHATQVQMRHVAFKTSLDKGSKWEKETEGALLHMSLLKQGVALEAENEEEGSES